MLNIESIKSGLVIDHIRAGSGAKIFSWLGLDKAEYSVALIMNAPSKAMGKKEIAEKITLTLPEKVENVIKCKNPRCITTTENYVNQIFHLVDKEKGQYRCYYCDELTSSRNF